MAKTYIDSVKYMIEIEFEIKGIVDKPDIIGAVFGQSEGLLGEQLDLRELQKNGRIGRIEITQNTNMGKTKGLLSIPSSLDMVETSILAARDLSFTEIVTRFSPGDFHPPLYYFLLKAWISIFRSGEVATRMLSVLFGLGTVLLNARNIVVSSKFSARYFGQI